MRDIPSQYNPKDFEGKIYSRWEKENLFCAEPSSSKKPFTIVIPPPNVTGILHMGHALNNTIQDILIRWKRMQGHESLWVPGTDHAGIATQNVVEKKIARENKKRQDLGREKFLEEVWEWRNQYGSTIINQLKRLGASCDWGKTRFTMDTDYSEAVKEVFVRLWDKKLIYQGNYIINWCPRCHTALSDEEAPHEDRQGYLYYIKYPFKEHQTSKSKLQDIIVATTRPETMLGDVAVAVNPKDRRYKKFIGNKLLLPLMNKEIPVIADDFVDKKFGTGAVKVTPAHDPNDFEIGNRHGLERVLVMNPDATMNENAGDFKGMDRFEAREAIVESLKERKLLVKIEPHSHAVGHCYRCNTVIEPYLSEQLFVSMKRLAKPAIEAVKKGKIKLYPKRWTKVYLHWMENIRDWCISRQIWWGHRIPVYYCDDCMKNGDQTSRQGIIVSKVKPDKCPGCGSANIKQHEDVLDTWFSSWLWPFATLGWPKPTKELKYFYPTDVLVTAPEILFFWVARMIMSGLEFMKDIPFRDVYIHGTVRDATGKKMSKSLGNIIDPIEIIDEFGADALRYSVIAITATGQDVFLSKDKFELGRNFANKIWNASRFVLMNISDINSQLPEKLDSLADKWILSRLDRTVAAVNSSLERYRFNEAEALIYDFFWHDYCDWYIEFIKPKIIAQSAERINQGSGEKETAHKKECYTGKVMMHVLENTLRLLHPFMPFITEAVWQNIRERSSIMKEKWPKASKTYINKKSEENIALIRDIIVNIRNVRASMNIPHSRRLNAYVVPLKKNIRDVALEGAVYIKNLARLDDLVIDENVEKPESCATVVMEGLNIFISLKDVIDIDSEKARLTAKINELKEKMISAEAKLKNKNFINKAPANIVALEKEKRDKISEKINILKGTLKNL